MDVLPGTHVTGPDYVVRQADRDQHFAAAELKQLLSEVYKRIYPLWLETSGGEVDRLTGQVYDLSEIGLSFDNRGTWYRHKPWLGENAHQRLEALGYAFAFTKQQICQGLWQASLHLRLVVSDQLRFAPSQDDLLIASLRLYLSENSSHQPQQFEVVA